MNLYQITEPNIDSLKLTERPATEARFRRVVTTELRKANHVSPKSPDKTATRPETATVTTQSPLSRIARRTRGQSHGPITRLMSPSDFARLLKPFVFLDIFDTQGKSFSGLGLHPHSGIATLTYVAEGSVSY